MVLYAPSDISTPGGVPNRAAGQKLLMPPSVTGMLILKTPGHTHSERGRGAAGGPADPRLPAQRHQCGPGRPLFASPQLRHDRQLDRTGPRAHLPKSARRGVPSPYRVVKVNTVHSASEPSQGSEPPLPHSGLNLSAPPRRTGTWRAATATITERAHVRCRGPAQGA